MELEKYQVLASRTEKEMPTAQLRLVHAALGFGSELGELLEGMKRLKGKPQERQENIKEELGDLCWYLAIASNALSVHMNQFQTWTSYLSLEGMIEELTIYIGQFTSAAKAYAIYGKNFDEDTIVSMHNIYSLLVDIAGIEHVPMDEVLQHNIAKLVARYPDKYTDENAIERLDKVDEEGDGKTPVGLDG